MLLDFTIRKKIGWVSIAVDLFFALTRGANFVRKLKVTTCLNIVVVFIFGGIILVKKKTAILSLTAVQAGGTLTAEIQI